MLQYALTLLTDRIKVSVAGYQMQYDFNDHFRMEIFRGFFIYLSSVTRLAVFLAISTTTQEKSGRGKSLLNLVDRFSLPLLFCCGEHYLLVVWRYPLNVSDKFSLPLELCAATLSGCLVQLTTLLPRESSLLYCHLLYYFTVREGLNY